jgi:hypothetical protein
MLRSLTVATFVAGHFINDAISSVIFELILGRSHSLVIFVEKDSPEIIW